MSVLAIIPAAGMGVRMGGGTPKQFLSLEGVPIFVHTLRKFVSSDAMDEIFLGLRAEDMERASKEIDREHFSKSVRLVAGGAIAAGDRGAVLSIRRPPPQKWWRSTTPYAPSSSSK